MITNDIILKGNLSQVTLIDKCYFTLIEWRIFQRLKSRIHFYFPTAENNTFYCTTALKKQ